MAREQGSKVLLDDPGESRDVPPVMSFAAPLLPPQRLGSERPNAGPRSFDPRVPREETTEVHVSIGRIEVTAVHETPPPRLPPPRAAKPMSLDEYLARRRGGRV
jgi:hypothetical protein